MITWSAYQQFPPHDDFHFLWTSRMVSNQELKFLFEKVGTVFTHKIETLLSLAIM